MVLLLRLRSCRIIPGADVAVVIMNLLGFMETPPRNVTETEDLRAVTDANKRSKTEESSISLPFDLIAEIFLRLPAKSLARCRCMSKRCDTYLRDPYFTDLFLTRSSSRPQILFACNKDGHLLFFSSSSSSPQPPHHSLDDDENSSLSTTNCYRVRIPYEFSLDTSFTAIKGLIFLRIERGLNGKEHVSLICNPSTGQSSILPRVKSRRKIGVRSFFGYDPVGKQYKVLSMTWAIYGSRYHPSEEHQVLTLGGGELSWRKIECSVRHNLLYMYHHVCIDGVLYYPARKYWGNKEYIIVCFDVRSEKFRCVKDTDGYTQLCRSAPLVNYNGKLASLGPEETVDGSCGSIRLRVLEDVETGEWSEHTFVLPEMWKSVVGCTSVRFVGVTRSNEIVLYSSCFQYLVYYDTERNTVVRVDIRGMEAVAGSQIFTLQDHIEDLGSSQIFTLQDRIEDVKLMTLF